MLLCMLIHTHTLTPQTTTLSLVQQQRHNNNTQQAHLVAVGVPHSPGCDARTTLSDPVLVRSWAIAGLPSDGHSIENAIFMARARRYPLLIDPQGQANRYIKTMGRDPAFSLNGLDVVKLSDKGLLRALENGIRFGRWVCVYCYCCC
jgi:dynein heavy chain, axonemal